MFFKIHLQNCKIWNLKMHFKLWWINLMHGRINKHRFELLITKIPERLWQRFLISFVQSVNAIKHIMLNIRISWLQTITVNLYSLHINNKEKERKWEPSYPTLILWATIPFILFTFNTKIFILAYKVWMLILCFWFFNKINFEFIIRGFAKNYFVDFFW